MARYVPDISTHRWVLIAINRMKREVFHDKKGVCIFCPGSEKLTPPEVLRYGEGKPDEPGWQVRVIPNKFPITDIHEVVIHSPWADRDIDVLPTSHIELIFKAYRDRFNFYKKNGQVLIFCNHGRHSGATVDYPHSQLVVIPNQINLDALAAQPVQNIVEETSVSVAYCPDFSQWPYEVWIKPKRQNILFGDITDVEILDIAKLLKKLVNKLEQIYKDNQAFEAVDKATHPFGYNYYIYPKEDWYIRIIPRFIHRAGFELGTGLSVNIIDPVDAARELR